MQLEERSQCWAPFSLLHRAGYGWYSVWCFITLLLIFLISLLRRGVGRGRRCVGNRDWSSLCWLVDFPSLVKRTVTIFINTHDMLFTVVRRSVILCRTHLYISGMICHHSSLPLLSLTKTSRTGSLSWKKLITRGRSLKRMVTGVVQQCSVLFRLVFDPFLFSLLTSSVYSRFTLTLQVVLFGLCSTSLPVSPVSRTVKFLMKV